MAKKKASAKKSNVKKSKLKKAIKKAVSKSSKVKSKKKTSPKTKKPVKAPAKKAAAKKSSPKIKGTAKASVDKASAIAKKSGSTKKDTSSKPSTGATTTAKAGKVLDLSGFVTPLDDRLMVQTVGTEKRTAGGLYIPETVADVSGNLHGYVVAVGRGHQNKKGHVLPMDVKVGDKVVFAEFSGAKITIQNQDLIILRESDVLGVIAK